VQGIQLIDLDCLLAPQIIDWIVVFGANLEKSANRVISLELSAGAGNATEAFGPAPWHPVSNRCRYSYSVIALFQVSPLVTIWLCE
jgi:hypothetical protein